MHKLAKDQMFKLVGDDPGESVNRERLGLVKAGFVALLVLVVFRLVLLQGVRGEELRRRSDENRIFVRLIPAERGVVEDRSGEVLATSKVVYELVEEGGKYLADVKPLSEEEGLELLASEPSRVALRPGRWYPQGEVGAHVVGYVGEVSPAEVGQGYLPGQKVGRMGVEARFEEQLSGTAGRELVEVDATSSVIRQVGERPAVPGEKLRLSLDLGLQRVLFEQLEGLVGAAVASDPKTGEILAMVSRPSFEPNLFVEREPLDKEVSDKELKFLLEDESRPLLNRAIGGVYPPGSVFKVVPATAALAEETIERETEIEDVGEIRVDEARFGNWYFLQYGKTDGFVDVVGALGRSNDIFFYKVGEKLGPKLLADWSREFGLGQKSGVGLVGEATGLVPDPLWKERDRGERWFLGNTYHLAIGQGDLLVTPIQAHQMMSVVANGGRLCEPQLLYLVEGRGRVSCRQLPIEGGVMNIVAEGLVAACEEGGTGYPFFGFELSQFGDEYRGEGRERVACKTGTAQFNDPDDRTHAWFSVYAPAKEPEILLTVLVEGGGEGSGVAAPIAKKGLEYWFLERHGGSEGGESEPAN